MEKFKKIKCEKLKTDIENEEIFTIKPLERGYANTIGNALRRIMLSSSMGIAPFAIRIENAIHEFEAIDGIKEDVVKIILNIKNIIFKYDKNLMENDQIFVCRIKGKSGEIKSSDLEDLDVVKVINKDQIIANVDPKSKLNLEIFLRIGRGYLSFQENKEILKKLESNSLLPQTLIQNAQTIAIDSDFSSIKKISFSSHELNTDSIKIEEELKINITTNGIRSPKEVLDESANTLVQHLTEIISNTLDFKERIFKEEKTKEDKNKTRQTDIKNIGLTVRSSNSLTKAGYSTLEEVAELSKKDIKNIRNLGDKSVNEIIEKLEEKGIELKDKGSK